MVLPVLRVAPGRWAAGAAGDAHAVVERIAGGREARHVALPLHQLVESIGHVFLGDPTSLHHLITNEVERAIRSAEHDAVRWATLWLSHTASSVKYVCAPSPLPRPTPHCFTTRNCCQ
jgi:hypothetical protein